MIKNISATIVFFLTVTISFSQDIITFKSGEDLRVVVEVINQTEVIYRKFDNPNGPRIITPKGDILMIRYENGTKDIFNVENTPPDPISPNSFDTDLYKKGQADATIYYKGYSGAGTATLITGLISPLVGLIPAIACSSTQPKEKNLNYPNTALIKKQDYYNGYSQKAKKIKQGKVWTNWGIAFGVNLVAYLIISAGQ